MVDLQDMHHLMQKEVTRKEFLQAVGIAVLSLIGVTHVLQSLHMGLERPNTPAAGRKTSYGYGSSAYGR